MAVVVVLLCLLRGSMEPLGVLWAVLPVMVLLFFFCWALATLSAFATVYFHDTAHLVEVGSQLFFFLTPIMYVRSILEDKGAKALVDLNPVVVFLELIRTPLVDGTLPAGSVYAQGVVLTLAAVGLAFGTIGWLQKKVIFHM
jgi:ABC-type polysaccharide/polyol phosphate export permease